MKVAIRYYSRGGHVQKMAEAMAKGVGVDAISIDEPGAEITSHVDLLFIGGALYKFQLDPIFKQYLLDLPEGLIDEAVCFGSSFLTRRPIYLIQEYLKSKGIKISKQAIYARNDPNDDLLGVIEYFAHNEVTRDRSLDGLPPYMVFKRSQELKEQREAAKAEGRDFEAEQDAENKRRAAEAAVAEAEAAAAQAPTEEAATAAEPVIETVEIPVDPITGDPIIVEDISSGAITITADGFDLYTLSRGGKPTGEPQKTLTFEGSADFCVMADGIIQYITFNGIQLAPQGDVTGMIFRNVTVDAEISGRDSKAALEASGRTVETVPASSEETKTEPESEPVTEPVEVETQQSETEAPAAADNASAGMVTITCEYCRFTGGGLSFVTSGSVPVGTVIMVASGSEGNIHNGYRINGGDPVNLDKASFRLTVTEDTTITMEKR